MTLGMSVSTKSTIDSPLCSVVKSSGMRDLPRPDTPAPISPVCSIESPRPLIQFSCLFASSDVDSLSASLPALLADSIDLVNKSNTACSP